ncbi:MAG: SurA N-terminal domain-containing protein [Pseudomonadota bacterium]
MAKKRNSASQAAVWVLLGLLIVALMGFGATSFVGNNSAVASVGDREITIQDYQNALQAQLGQFARQFGGTVPPMLLPLVQQQAMQQLISVAAMENEAEMAGISAGDDNVRDELLTIPNFQGVDGEFDREGYAFELRRANLSETEFETQLRADISRRLLTNAVTSGAQTPDALAEALLLYANEARAITWTVLAEADLETPIDDPSDEELTAFWEDNPDTFMLPQTRRITYAWLTPEMVAETIEATDEDLQALYEESSALYNQPERRLLERLVFSSQEEAEAAAAAIEAEEQSFDDVVASRDLTLADIDLGDVARDALGDLGEAIFAMEGPGVIGPLETDLGPALFRMNGILPAQSVSFDEARPELLAAFRAEAAENAVSSRIEEADDLLAGGATIEDLADGTELELGQIDYVQGSAEAIAALPEFRQAALSAEEGDFPEILLANNGTIFALRLDEVIEPRVEPFEEAREAVETDWRRVATVAALVEQAEGVVEEVRNLPMPDQAALEEMIDPLQLLPGSEDDEADAADAEESTPDADERFQTETGLVRTDTLPDTPTGFVETIYEMEAGDVRIVEGATAAYIVRLDAVTAPDLSEGDGAEDLETLQTQLSASVGLDILQAFATAVQNDAGITINEAARNAVHTGLGGHGGM